MSIADGPIFQVCWVVPDIAAATGEFAARYGVAEWFTIPDVHFRPESCVYRGVPADYAISVALGYAGGQQLELIEPRSGDSLYSEQLMRIGPGLHHIAWVPDDFDAALADARAAGREIVAQGAFEGVGMEFAYLDGGPIGSYVELMRLSPEMKAMFDYLIPEGHANPWA
ncbi:VOC family protein [Nocardia sp. NPDC050710]|uniref:VOC family protein n=1 Tax=Nocardia sp. NPDC050710 TaxID=3157220 RepID=UPI0033EE5FF9